MFSPSLFNKALITFFASLVFLAMLPFAAHAQNTWQPPTGAPPNSNAPAPIHTGSTGQGKGWGNLLPNWSIGSHYFSAWEGYIGRWAFLDKEGVATTRVCLGSPTELNNSGFPSGSVASWEAAGLDCIGWEDGWSSGGDGGNGGDASLPNGETGKEILAWFAKNGVYGWYPLEHTEANESSATPFFRFGNNADANASVNIAGDLKIKRTAVSGYASNVIFNKNGLNTIGGTKTSIYGPLQISFNPLESTPVGAILRTVDTAGNLEWATSEEIGLGGGGGQDKYTSLFSPGGMQISMLDALQLKLTFGDGLVTQSNGIGTNSFTISVDPEMVGSVDPEMVGSGLPDGYQNGNMLFWNNDTQEWELSAASGYSPDNGFISTYPDNKFTLYSQNIDTYCKDGGSLFTKFVNNNLRSIDCTDELRYDFNNGDGPVVHVEYLAHGLEDVLRPVCSDDEGGLVTCGNLSTGTWQQAVEGSYTFTIPDGVYEITVTARAGGGGGGAGGMGRANAYMTNITSIWPLIYGGGGGGGGGGEGQTVTQTIDVLPGEVHNVVVGHGGRGGCPDGGPFGNFYGGSHYCDVQTFSPFANKPWNGEGSNGAATTFYCDAGDLCQTVEAQPGRGGQVGGTLYFEAVDSGTETDVLNVLGVAGGVARANGDGNTTAQAGTAGDVWYHTAPEDPSPGIACGSNYLPLYHYAGGRGGSGAGGTVGGAGGPDKNLTAIVYPGAPEACFPNQNAGIEGHGFDGQTASLSGKGGAGGGGGNSQIGWGGGQNALDVGRGGRGGSGADGFIAISW